jgi:hypothetical protein
LTYAGISWALKCGSTEAARQLLDKGPLGPPNVCQRADDYRWPVVLAPAQATLARIER